MIKTKFIVREHNFSSYIISFYLSLFASLPLPFPIYKLSVCFSVFFLFSSTLHFILFHILAWNIWTGIKMEWLPINNCITIYDVRYGNETHPSLTIFPPTRIPLIHFKKAQPSVQYFNVYSFYLSVNKIMLY